MHDMVVQNGGVVVIPDILAIDPLDPNDMVRVARARAVRNKADLDGRVKHSLFLTTSRRAGPSIFLRVRSKLYIV